MKQNPALKGGRFVAINCWRPLTPVKRWPLALCDASSVAKQDVYRRETPENHNWVLNAFPPSSIDSGNSRHSGDVSQNGNMTHRWVFYPDMLPQEMLIFKSWDEDVQQREREDGGDGQSGQRSKFTLHSAFDDNATTPKSPVRMSLEARFVLMYPPADAAGGSAGKSRL